MTRVGEWLAEVRKTRQETIWDDLDRWQDCGSDRWPAMLPRLYGPNRMDQIMPNLDRLESMLSVYEARFGDQDVVVVSSPGRAELLGNYQDNLPAGITLSAAINQDVLAIAGKDLEYLSMYDLRLNEAVDMRMGQLPGPEKCRKDNWHPYPIGICSQVRQGFSQFEGVNIVVHGNVPNGAGCSSSAAFENAIVYSINSLYELGMDIHAMARISKRAENCWKGKGCGWLDQLTSLVGGIVLIDYSDPARPAYEQLDSPWFNGWHLVSAKVDEGHARNDDLYNEVKKDLEYVARKVGLKTMKGDAQGIEQYFENVERESGRQLDPDSLRAADRGIFYAQEYNRVLEGIKALNKGCAYASDFGEAMNASGDGSRDLLLNTNRKIDEAVSIARGDGAYARVHGGGFKGGPIVLTKYPEDIIGLYEERFGKGCAQKHFIRPGVTELRLA